MAYEYGKRYEVSGDQNAATLIREMTIPRIGVQTVELDFGDEGTERVRIEGSDRVFRERGWEVTELPAAALTREERRILRAATPLP